MAELTYEPQPHPYLHEPRIFVSGLPLWITDAHLANALQFCAPFRPNIIRDQTQPLAAGTIEFRFLEKAEKALATLHDRAIPDVTPSVTLCLSPFPYTIPPTPLPPPAALPRLVKHLPHGYTDSMIYDIFRPYGALANVRAGVTGPDSALVEYWREEDARVASETLHCADIGGANIAIQLYQPRRAPGPQVPELHANAPSFVPTGGGFSYPNSQYSPSPPRGSPFSRGQLPFVHGPGQQVQPAPPGTSHSGLIDPCNLFCKNLDPEIDSNGLFSHFRRFGQIVSARVMRNETGESRGFGFVSFQQPEQANAALAAMNGAMLGTKAIVVRLHEPKQFRQEKLAARFQGNGHPRSASGATSPTLSVDGDSSFGGGNWNSPRHVSSPLSSPHSGNGNFQERHIRRASGSYYTAALNGTLSVPLDYDGLASLSPVMRREILTGELSKRVKALDAGVSDIDTIVEDLINLALSDVVQGLADNTRLAEQVASVQQQRQQQQQQQQAEQPTSTTTETEGASGTVTAPEHPSTPVSLGPSLATPPRTASPAGSIAPQGTERERMAAAITKIAPGQSDALTDLLMSLPKKERAQCLFNPERLRMKVGEAQAILEADDEDEEGPSSATTSAPTPATPVSKPAQTPATPELSRAPSAAPSPMPATPSAPTTTTTESPAAGDAAYTLVSLARLPAAEIVRLASAGTVTGVPLPKADPAVAAQTDKFIDDMRDKPVQSQKQALGDKLFRVVKAFGIKGAPKLTIKLLDSEDLRALAHLMNSYPSVLKEKALLVQAETK